MCVFHQVYVMKKKHEPVKWIVVYRNGEKSSMGRRIVIKPREIRSFDRLLEEVTLKLNPSFGAVRSIFTPERGTRVTSLDRLQTESHYVAAGCEKFRPLSKTRYTELPVYLSNRSLLSLRPPDNKKTVTDSKSAEIKSHQVPTSPRVQNIGIQVVRNGDSGAEPLMIQIQAEHLKKFESLLQCVSDRMKFTVHRLYDKQGSLVLAGRELRNNGLYIAAGLDESFDSSTLQSDNMRNSFQVSRAQKSPTSTKKSTTADQGKQQRYRNSSPNAAKKSSSPHRRSKYSQQIHTEFLQTQQAKAKETQSGNQSDSSSFASSQKKGPNTGDAQIVRKKSHVRNNAPKQPIGRSEDGIVKRRHDQSNNSSRRNSDSKPKSTRSTRTATLRRKLSHEPTGSTTLKRNNSNRKQQPIRQSKRLKNKKNDTTEHDLQRSQKKLEQPKGADDRSVAEQKTVEPEIKVKQPFTKYNGKRRKRKTQELANKDQSKATTNNTNELLDKDTLPPVKSGVDKYEIDEEDDVFRDNDIQSKEEITRASSQKYIKEKSYLENHYITEDKNIYNDSSSKHSKTSPNNKNSKEKDSNIKTESIQGTPIKNKLLQSPRNEVSSSLTTNYVSKRKHLDGHHRSEDKESDESSENEQQPSSDVTDYSGYIPDNDFMWREMVGDRVLEENYDLQQQLEVFEDNEQSKEGEEENEDNTEGHKDSNSTPYGEEEDKVDFSGFMNANSSQHGDDEIQSEGKNPKSGIRSNVSTARIKPIDT